MDKGLKMTDDYSALQTEAHHLAEQLFGNETEKCAGFTNRLLDICTKAQGKDFLLIHNPGGWGGTRIEHCMRWERSIVEGVCDTIQRLGYSWLLIQYFRSGSGWRAHMWDIKDQARFFFKGKFFKVEVMAAELKFIAQHVNSLKVILIGVSQGAAFGDAVMLRLGGSHRIYSIELGMPFFYKSRQVVTERTLALNSNGLMPDALMEWDIITAVKAFSAAPFRWIKYQLQGNPVKLGHCINLPGHDYNWEYPEVRQQIGDFLEINFGTKSNLEESLL